MGWDDLENYEPEKKPPADIDVQIARLFCTEEGLKVLTWFRERYVNVPIASPGTDPSFAFYAEGQRQVIMEIMARITKARKS